ncbi:MAG TPA: DUF2892 domain-containing protein [Leptolinea sp.]
MKTNESMVDRGIRVVIGLALLALGFGGAVTGTLGTVFKVLGFVPLLTGLIGYCPIYGIFKYQTNR